MTRFTTTLAETAGLDTNVLIYAYDREAPQHKDSAALLEKAYANDGCLCIVPQVIMEFYGVVTGLGRVEHPLSSQEVIDFFMKLLRPPGVQYLEAPATLASLTLSLADQLEVRGRRIFDLQLAAAYQSHSIRKLYTYNIKHFARIPDFEVMVPPSADSEPSA